MLSKLDLTKGFHQVEVLEEDRPKTAFICPWEVHLFLFLLPLWKEVPHYYRPQATPIYCDQNPGEQKTLEVGTQVDGIQATDLETKIGWQIASAGHMKSLKTTKDTSQRKEGEM